jgi:murein DD-endopeptidase MepM/ murein hydrolase activator NlpD
MSITILQRSSQGMRSIKLHNIVLGSLVLLFISVVIIAGVSGYYYAASEDKAAKVEQLTIDNWQNEIDNQWKEINLAKSSSQQKINALTARLGLLQAHVTRIDAAGERLLSLSGIDKKEFNFDQLPAVGGPTVDLSSQDQTEAQTDIQLQNKVRSIADNIKTDRQASGEFNQPNMIDYNEWNDIFERLGRSLESREQQFQVIESLLMDKHMGVERYISGRPTTKGWLSSFYGKRNDPFTGKPAWHNGVDFAGSEGDNVISTAAGVVSWVGERSGYGLLIEINHGDGLVTRYGHNKAALIEKGAVVKKNQIISIMGNSGRSTGAHVHYEVIKNGKPVNPIRYINRLSTKG